jgi:predicted transposase YdaD
MLLTEYDEMEQMELFREEGRKEGREEGREEGRKEGQKEGTIQTLAELVKKGLLSINDAAAQAKMTEDAFIAKMKAV